MAKELSDWQRKWLDTAIGKKGRFTTKAAVKKQMQDYVRREDKILEAMKGLAEDHPEYGNLKQQLDDAKNFAKDGDLKSAYKSLDATKLLVKAAIAGRADVVRTNILEGEIRRYAYDMGVAKTAKDNAVAPFIDLEPQVEGIEAVSEACETFDEAMDWLRDFIPIETQIRGALAEAKDKLATVVDDMMAFNLADRAKSILRDIKVLQLSGNAKAAAPLETRILDLVARRKADSKLESPRTLPSWGEKQIKAFDLLLKQKKSLGKWQVRDGDSVTDDDQTAEAREGLTANNEARLELVRREEKRLAKARTAIEAEFAHDQHVLSDTDLPDQAIPPQPASFNADALNGLSGGQLLGDQVTAEQKQAVTTAVTQKITEFLTDLQSEPDEIFDLSIKSRAQLMEMIAQETLGQTDPTNWTDSQKEMLEEATTSAETAMCANLPNQIADDGSTVSIGGVVYSNPIVLKAGGNGVTKLYKDAEGNPIVVKTPITNTEGKRDDAVWEMQVHYRATKEDDEDSALVGFHGALRSPDGQLHMVLEAVDGGDLKDRGDAISIAAATGMIPEEARQAIAVNELLAAARAMKELEMKGLVHRDLKGLNVMMTKQGKVKIIDFGESEFIDEETGSIPGDQTRQTTPGFASPETFDMRDHDTKSDSYSLGAMFRNMAQGLDAGHDTQNARMDGGTLGRVIAGLTDPDPTKRPSMDAILQSALATSYEKDFNEDNVKDLQQASLEFSVQMASVRGDLDVDDLETKVTSNISGELKPTMKALDVQNLISALEAKSTDKWQEKTRNPQENAKKLESLENYRKDIDVLKHGILAPMVKAETEKSEARFKEDLEDATRTFEMDLGKGPQTLTLKQASRLRDQIDTKIAESRERAMLILNDREESQELQVKVDRVNTELTRLDKIARDLDDAIFNAVRKEAQFFLARAKMEKAAAAFR